MFSSDETRLCTACHWSERIGWLSYESILFNQINHSFEKALKFSWINKYHAIKFIIFKLWVMNRKKKMSDCLCKYGSGM